MSVNDSTEHPSPARSGHDEASAEGLALENRLLELQVRQLQLELEHQFLKFRAQLQQAPRAAAAAGPAASDAAPAGTAHRGQAAAPDREEQAHRYGREMGEFADALKGRGVERMVVWGGGEIGRALVAAAGRRGIEVTAVVDRDPSLAGRCIEGVRIVPPDELVWEGLYAVASHAYAEEICAQIADLAQAFALAVEISTPDGRLLALPRAGGAGGTPAVGGSALSAGAGPPGDPEQQRQALADLATACRHRPWSLALLLRRFHLEARAGALDGAGGTLREIEKRGIDSRSSALLREWLIQCGDRRSGDQMVAAVQAPAAGSWHELRRRIREQERLRVVFVNDSGFSFGAGTALRRQLLSFLNAGHEVATVCWREPMADDEALRRYALDWRWLGRTTLPELSVHSGSSRLEMTRRIVAAINAYTPHLVIAGNFHAAGWPLDVLTQLHRDGIPVVAYAHDCDWASGGCGYPAWYDCERYLTGCVDGECPKPAGGYPPATENSIERNWLQRTAVFSAGADPLPLATNSSWSGELLRRRFGGSAPVDILHYGLDTELFRPGDKRAIRAEMGLPVDAFIILVGSIFFGQPGKGARYLRELFDHYAGDDRVHFLSFGHPSAELARPGLTQAGYVSCEQAMARLYQAADLFVNPVEVEAFGQTMLEASACGCPVVAFAACGVPDVAREALNAVIAKSRDRAGLIDAIEQIRASAPLRRSLSSGGRQLAEGEFSLQAQYRRWELYLRRLCEARFLRQTLALWREKAACTRPCAPYRAGATARAGGLRCRGREKVDFADAPLITVATVVYNDAAGFGETLFSVLEQEYPNLEWIVIDGGSTDGTVERLQHHDAEIDLWISEPDRGIYDAMNKAAALANGRWVIYMNAGDLFCGPAAISEAFSSAPADADFVYGQIFYRLLNGSQSLQRTADFDAKWERLMAGELGSEPWLFGLPPHQATFAKTALVRRLKFDIGIKVAADWDLLFRAKRANASFHRTDRAVALFSAGGFSTRHAAQWIREVWASARSHSPHTAAVDQHFALILERHERDAGCDGG